MKFNFVRGMGVAGLAALTACSAIRRDPAEETARGPEAASVVLERGAVVLTGDALADGAGSVLGAMAGKVPSMRVSRRPNTCPLITLRSSVNFDRVINPHVYVDGTRATDTCVLESIRTTDVERVEVYPQGFTSRPGYGTHAQGLILVFMRSG